MNEVVDTAPAVDAVGSTFDVVMEITRRGAAEIDKPAFGLSRNQRLLLQTIDGARSLRDCLAISAALDVKRLPRDAARLVAFGLAKIIGGELPQALIVEAMNLTQRIPLDRLRPLAPERHAVPMQPRVATAQRVAPVATPAQAARQSRRPLRSWVLVLLLLAAAFAAGIWPPR